MVALVMLLASFGCPVSVGLGASPPAVKVGVSLALTGPDARRGVPMLQGIQLAIQDADRRGLAGGYSLEVVPQDSAAPEQHTLGRYRATVASYERFVADAEVIAAIGPQTSPEGRAVAALLSRANLATITPCATTFDIADPSLRAGFRSGDRTVFFRTIGTDLAQGDAMARFAHASLAVDVERPSEAPR